MGLDKKRSILENWVVLSLVDSDLLNGTLVRMTTDGSVDRNDFAAPVEVTEVIKESLKDVQGSFKIIVEIVEEECDQDVEGICSHVSSM